MIGQNPRDSGNVGLHSNNLKPKPGRLRKYRILRGGFEGTTLEKYRFAEREFLAKTLEVLI